MSLPTAYEPFPHHGERGPFIVLEGVSGIGKTTLTELLTSRLRASSLHTLPTPHSGWSTVASTRLRPFPQLGFYLSGLLHAADCVRQGRAVGPVVADRYASSVAACHAAVHGIEVTEVQRLIEPFVPYLEVPTHTFYLRCSEDVLRDRMTTKAAAAGLTPDDRDLFGVPGRLTRLLANFEDVAAKDPTAVVLDTDGRSPDDLAHHITHHLETAGA